MTPSRKLKLASSLAAVLSAAAMSGVATNAHAYAYAQADIFIENALLTLTNVTVNGASNTAQTQETFGGSNTSQSGSTSSAGCLGPNCGAYVPTPLTQPTTPTNNFAGATATLTGSLIGIGATVTTDATTSLASAGNGLSGSQLFNNAGFTVTVGTGGGVIGLSFDARGFLRAALSQPQETTSASIAQSFQISTPTGLQLLKWTPNGGGAGESCDTSGGALSGFSCSVTSSPFDLNNSTGQNFVTGDIQIDKATTAFGGAFSPFAITVDLPAGTYSFTASSQVQSSAKFVPEPGLLSLLGAAFMGLGWIARRRPLSK